MMKTQIAPTAAMNRISALRTLALAACRTAARGGVRRTEPCGDDDESLKFRLRGMVNKLFQIGPRKCGR